MIKKVFTGIFQGLLSTFLLLMLLEGACFFLGFPQGAGDYMERVILQQKLELRKPAGQCRVFVYGESTVHGAGYSPTSSPVKWLDAYLKDFLPGRDIKVVNFGRLGEESDFIAQSFLDTLQYKPDLAIFYLGHNTFYPDNRVDFVKKRESEFKSRLRKAMRHSRLISAVIRETIKRKIRRHAQKIEDVMGDVRIEAYPMLNGAGYRTLTLPGSPTFKENVAFFRGNIERIIHAAGAKRVPALFMKPVCNLKDYPPDFSSHIKPLSQSELTRFDELYKRGLEAAERKDSPTALDLFNQAREIDPTYADLSYRLGQLCFQSGEIDKARLFFEDARDQDAVIRRAPKDILLVFESLAEKNKINYFDTEKALVSSVPGGILGWPIIEDNVHLSLEGQALVGRALAGELAQRNWIAPRADWQFGRERPMASMESDLGITRRTLFLNYCAVVGYLGHRFEERLQFAQRAFALFPEDPVAQRQLAWAYWLTGDKAKALEIYRLLAKKDPAALEAAFNAQPELRKAYDAPASVQTAPQ